MSSKLAEEFSGTNYFHIICVEIRLISLKLVFVSGKLQLFNTYWTEDPRLSFQIFSYTGYVKNCIVRKKRSDSLASGKKSKTIMGRGSFWQWKKFWDNLRNSLVEVVRFQNRGMILHFTFNLKWVFFLHDNVFLICFSIVDVMDYIRLHRKIHSQEGSKALLSDPLVYDKKNFEVSYIENIA